MRGDGLGALERAAIEQIRRDAGGPEGVAIGLAEPSGLDAPSRARSRGPRRVDVSMVSSSEQRKLQRRLQTALLHESSMARTRPIDRILTCRCDTTLVGRGRSSD